MLDHFIFPSEPGVPAETSHGRRWWPTAKWPGIGFSALGSLSERSLTVRRLLREQDQVGAAPIALTISRDANTGAGQGFTDLAAAVQLRLRVAFGLQALQRCSGLLNRRARGSTVATHHFNAPVAQTIRVRRFERRGCR